MSYPIPIYSFYSAAILGGKEGGGSCSIHRRGRNEGRRRGKKDKRVERVEVGEGDCTVALCNNRCTL